MPTASKIIWVISDREDVLGEYIPEPHTITISLARQGHFENICKTILHEMVHMLLYLEGKTYYERHDKRFKAWTAKIAGIYGFDPKEL
jgi:predicted SprT family Zn-dependent metalloprotease